MSTAQNLNAQNVNTDHKCGNTSQNFHNARRAKDDEFYTPFNVVADELDNYNFHGQRVFCPCDNEKSAFVQYFKLKNIDVQWRSYTPPTDLLGDVVKKRGVFETDEEFDKGVAACDVIVTNPPFSKWRSFFDTVIASGKKFLILGKTTAASVSSVFAAIKAGKVWAGNSGQIENCYFERPNGAPARKVPVIWYTNLDKPPRAPFVPKNQLTVADLKARGLWETFNERPDVLNVNFVHNIPVDYYGLIAVGAHAFYRFQDGGWEFVEGNNFCDMKVGDRCVNARLVIRRKQNAAVENIK